MTGEEIPSWRYSHEQKSAPAGATKRTHQTPSPSATNDVIHSPSRRPFLISFLLYSAYIIYLATTSSVWLTDISRRKARGMCEVGFDVGETCERHANSPAVPISEGNCGKYKRRKRYRRSQEINPVFSRFVIFFYEFPEIALDTQAAGRQKYIIRRITFTLCGYRSRQGPSLLGISDIKVKRETKVLFYVVRD